MSPFEISKGAPDQDLPDLGLMGLSLFKLHFPFQVDIPT
jgi:hypothetical protein